MGTSEKMYARMIVWMLSLFVKINLNMATEL